MTTNAVQLLNDNEEAMRQVLSGWQVGMWTALPGIVLSVNMAAMTCEVQPTIQAVVQNENNELVQTDLPPFPNVPIVFPSAGGFSITFPVAVGDEVLVVFSSRCIDAWWQLGGVQQAMEARMNDLSDGFAIPGPRSQPRVLSGISTTALQIRNDANTARIEIAANGAITIVSPTGVAITGNLVVSGQVTAGSIPLSTHKHTGVTTGAGVTGGPTV